MRKQLGTMLTRRAIALKTLALGGLSAAQSDIVPQACEGPPFCGVVATPTLWEVSALAQLVERFNLGLARATWWWGASSNRFGVCRIDFSVARGLIVGECVSEFAPGRFELVGIHPSNLLQVLRSEGGLHAFGAPTELEHQMQRIAPLNSWTRHRFSTDVQ